MCEMQSSGHTSLQFFCHLNALNGYVDSIIVQSQGRFKVGQRYFVNLQF